jgi:hypothetical protein
MKTAIININHNGNNNDGYLSDSNNEGNNDNTIKNMKIIMIMKPITIILIK